MRGLGWGASAGPMVLVVYFVVAVVAWDAGAMLLGLFIGVPAFVTGTFTGGLLAWLSWKALVRGVQPVWIVVAGAVGVGVFIPVLIWAAGVLINMGMFDRESVLYLSLSCIPAYGAAVFGLWFTVRNLVRRVELREERVLLPQ